MRESASRFALFGRRHLGTALRPVILRTRVRLRPRGVALLLLGFAVVLSTAFSLLRPAQTNAATSNTINFQARLESNTGAIAPDGVYNVEFKLYNASSSSGSSQGSCTGDANCLWTEDYLVSASHGVTVTNGYLTVNLGSITSFPGTIKWDQQLYLTMNIGQTGGSPTWDGEMSPRLTLTALPYAFRAGVLADPANTGSILNWASQGGANTIQIPNAGAGVTATLCLQSSSACGFALGSGTAFVQGGNSFTAPADLGTNDANVLNLRTNGNTRLTVSTSGDLTFAASNTISTSLTNGNITLQANGNGIATVDTGASGTVAVGTSANNKTINIGAVSSTANTTAIHIGDTSANATQTITIGSSGSASSTLTLDAGTGSTAIQIGNTDASHGIQIGTTGTSTHVNTVTIGSTNSTSSTTVQGGTNGISLKVAGGSSNQGVLVKPSTTSGDTSALFQVQNANSAILFNIDSTNPGTISLLTNNGAETGAWQTNANSLNAVRRKLSTVVANGYIYALGGDNGGDQATVMFAKINANGSVGAWSCQGTAGACGTALNSNALPAARSNGAAVAVNGYIYYLGGTSSDAVYYAKLNADGSTGTWQTGANVMNSGTAVINGSGFTANGYIYVIAPSGSNTAYWQAKANPDGTTGTWTRTTMFTTPVNWGGLAVANGYVYLAGGEDGVGAARDSTFYGKINTDGTLGTWKCEASSSSECGGATFTSLALPAVTDVTTAQAANGYLYVIGGLNSTGKRTVYYTDLNSDGSLVGYNTSANLLPNANGVFWAGSVQTNGYFYLIGGTSGSLASPTVLSSVYYASLARIATAGSLDLVGTSGQDLQGNGNQAGSLTAGNTLILGTLGVSSTASFLQNVAVAGTLSVADQVALTSASTTNASLVVTNSSASSNDVIDVTASALSTGNALSISSSTGNSLTTGSLLTVVANSQTSASNIVHFQADSLAGGTLLSVTSASSSLTTGALLAVTANSATIATGGIVQVQGNALTTGSALTLTKTGHTLTTGNLLSVVADNETNPQNGVAEVHANNLIQGDALLLVKNGATLTTGSLLHLKALSETTPSAGIFQLQADALTTGIGLGITADSGSTLSTGALLQVVGNSETTATGGLVQLSGSGLTTGVLLQLSGSTAETTGSTLNVTSGRSVFTPTNTIASAAGATWNGVQVAATTATVTGTTSITGSTPFSEVSIAQPTITDASAETITNAATLFIGGAPAPGGSVTITNSAGIWNNGFTRTALVGNGGGGAVCSSLGSGVTPTNGVSYLLEDCSSTPLADYAENYPVASGVNYGDLVSLGTQSVNTYADDGNGNVDWSTVKGQISQLVKSSVPYQSTMIGVVSDNHSDFTSAGYNIKQENNPMPIALNGRVPVNVTTENGPIEPGDYLTASATHPGYAMKATQAGYVIGRALAAYTSTDPGQVMVFVGDTYYPGPSPSNYLQNGGDASLSSLFVSGSADFNDLNVSGNLTLNNLTATGSTTIVNLTVTAPATFQSDITIGGHIITAGGQPTVQVQSAAGQQASVTISGNDTTGTITITTGDSPSSGALANILFSKLYSNAPHIVISPSNDKASALRYYKGATNVNDFMFNSLDTPAAHTTYQYDYFIAQ